MTTATSSFLRVAGALALSAAFSACAAGAPPTPLSLDADFAKADATHSAVTDVLDLGDGIRLPAHIETTTQGNGMLTIANLTLRLKDKHDDGLVYAGNGVLRLDVVRLAGRASAPALIVSGTAMHTGEKESDPQVPESVVYVYEVDCAAGRLVRTWRNTSVDIELDTNAPGGAVHCAK
jgi:hypothetical protein